MTRRTCVRKLQAMAAAAAEEQMTLVLEPLNPFVDHPGYWLTTMTQAADILEEVASPNLKILYDIYHQQMTEGKIIDNLRKYAAQIGHIHVAGAPGRTNLVGGDLDYRAVFGAIDAAGYGEATSGLSFARPEMVLRHCVRRRSFALPLSLPRAKMAWQHTRQKRPDPVGSGRFCLRIQVMTLSCWQQPTRALVRGRLPCA